MINFGVPGIEEVADEVDESTTNPAPKPAPMNVAEGSDANVTFADPEDDGATERGDLRTEQFKGLCKVRFIHTYRNKISLFFRIVMPLVFIIAGVAMYEDVDVSAAEPDPLKMAAATYVNTTVSPWNPDMVYQLSITSG